MIQHTIFSSKDQHDLARLLADYGVSAVVQAMSHEVDYRMRGAFPNDSDYQTQCSHDAAILSDAAERLTRGYKAGA